MTIAEPSTDKQMKELIVKTLLKQSSPAKKLK